MNRLGPVHSQGGCESARGLGPLVKPLPERVVALSHHKYRTWSVPHDSFGGTAHEHVLEARAAVSRDDDQVDLEIASNICDDLKRCPYLDDHVF